MMVPPDILIGVIYDHLSEQNPELDRLPNTPLGVHPLNTREAKEERARTFANVKAGNF